MSAGALNRHINRRLCQIIVAILCIFVGGMSKTTAETTQFVFPEKIYVGDTAEIRFIFDSKIDLFQATPDISRMEIKKENEIFNYVAKKCLVKSAFLDKNAQTYTLTIEIVAWENGYIDFPPFDMASLVRKSLGNSKLERTAPVIIDLKPVRIDSVVQRTQQRVSMPPAPPLLVPGTVGLLIFLAVLLLVILAGTVFALTKIQWISSRLGRLILLRALQKNTRRTVKGLENLMKKSHQIESDRDFAEQFQKILRNFLCVRFSEDFSSLVTSKIESFFFELCAGELSESQQEPVEKLIEIFTRTDFIRFAGKENNAAFRNGERDELVQTAMTMTLGFDENIQEEA